MESSKSKWALRFGCVWRVCGPLVDENSPGGTVLIGRLFFKIISKEIRARITKLNGWFTVEGLSKINLERDTNMECYGVRKLPLI